MKIKVRDLTLSQYNNICEKYSGMMSYSHNCVNCPLAVSEHVIRCAGVLKNHMDDMVEIDDTLLKGE